ncbi:hypothetical protein [uncultured Bacteroides sp.]|uniref:hypothetical protein n=1 Tax=uncultured Bacteroides sp. TaxID=162156 RepID=UPI002AA7E6FD|nr:hypothetical protein [uncultured Bacteroides sp.]
MIYTGQFKNINNVLYQVDIQVDNNIAGTSEIVFSDEPFSVEYNNGSTIYEPLKLSNATCTIVSNNYLFDLYSATAQGSKITLTNVDKNVIEWVGYITPNIYNQGWENNFEKIEIEAIDGLSTLDNYKYFTIDNDNKKIKSFQDLLIHCIKQCNCYKNIYINQNCYLSSKVTDNRIYNQFMYLYNFGGLTGYFRATYPVSTTVKIIVNGTTTYTIMKGETQSDEKNSVNSFDSIVISPHSDENYWYVKTEAENYPDIINIFNNIYISEQNFFTDDDKNDDKIKDGKTYKEVLIDLMQFLGYTITTNGDSVYILDYDYIKGGYVDYTLLSTSDNWLTYTSTGTTISDSHSIVLDDFRKNGSNIELDTVYNQIKITTNEKKISALLPDFFNDDFLTNVKSDNAKWNDYQSFSFNDKTYLYKYYKNSNYKNHYYNNDVDWTEPTVNSIDYDTLINKIGASFIRVTNYDATKATPASLSFSDYICLHRHLEAYNNSSNQTQWSTTKNKLYPVLSLNAGTVAEAGYIYNDYYLVINGSALWDDRGGVAYFDDGMDKRNNDDNYNVNNLKLTASLKIGNKYWTGENWQTGEATFNIIFDKGDQDHLNYSFFNVKNNIQYNEWIGQSGQKIPIMAADQLVGDVEFSLYSPQAVDSAYRVDCVWLKDFKIDLIKPAENIKDDTNTEYKNVINSNFVNEFSDLNINVMSDTNKGLNYSVVLEYPSSEIGFQNNQYICTKTFEINQKAEFNLIQKYVNQYSTPRKKLNLTLDNNYNVYTSFTCDKFNDDKFIVNKMSIDYYNNNNTLTIIEKI